VNETLRIPVGYAHSFGQLAELRYPGDGMQAAHSWTWETEAQAVLAEHLAKNEKRLRAHAETADARRAAAAEQRHQEAQEHLARLNQWQEV
jgi:hypothetical protein